MKVAAGVDVDHLAGHGLGAASGNSDFPRGSQNTRCRNAAMDGLSLFGLFAVSAMLVFCALEHRSRWFILAFAGACALGSAYGFLQGAWPFGLVEAIWCGVAARRWWFTS
jgi:hypothetical protein